MRNLSENINTFIASIEGTVDSIKINKRAAAVRDMWETCVEEIFLQHTNAVFIIHENERKILIVYVDESLFAAELNAQREIIRLKFLELFMEKIDEFKILISRGKYKKNYPFKKNSEFTYSDTTPSVGLSLEEKETINEMVTKIDNEKLREKVKTAMITSLEWEKGKRYKNKEE